MALGWINFSKSDGNIAFNVLKLLEEPGAVDEMRIILHLNSGATYNRG